MKERVKEEKGMNVVAQVQRSCEVFLFLEKKKRKRKKQSWLIESRLSCEKELITSRKKEFTWVVTEYNLYIISYWLL